MLIYKAALIVWASSCLALTLGTVDESLISDVLTEAENEVDQHSLRDLVDRMEEIPGHARRGITAE